MSAKPPRGKLWGLVPAVLGLSLALVLLAGEQVDFLRLTTAPPTAATIVGEQPSPTVELSTATPQPTATPMRPVPTAMAAPPTPTLTPRPTATPRSYSAPVRLGIPRVGIDGPVIPVGLGPERELEVPGQAHQIGWYKHGVAPGQRGNALFDGHVDWRRSTAVFFNLGKVEPGDEIVVTNAEGEQLRFVVEWKELYRVEMAPLDRIFEHTSTPTITLMTCGGLFDRTAQSYTHRWVVRAGLSAGPATTTALP